MLLAEASTVIVQSDRWWVTAAVAVGAAMLGSFAGAAASYFASVSLEDRRRRARSETRRKAKIYTPIREELAELQRGIAEDRHFSHYGIQRRRPIHETFARAPGLTLWRELVEDGRATTAASARVRTALTTLEGCADDFNRVLGEAREVFEQRGKVIAGETGFAPPVGNWYDAYLGSVFRDGIRDSRAFREPSGSSVATTTAAAFARAWDADPEVSAVQAALRESEDQLRGALKVAVHEVDSAIARIAEKYEQEPRD